MNQRRKKQNKISDDAVLLIPEPDGSGAAPAYGIQPGYYNHSQLLKLIDDKKGKSGAIRFIADMLETGNPEDDEFASLLRRNCSDPSALARIVRLCKSEPQ